MKKVIETSVNSEIIKEVYFHAKLSLKNFNGMYLYTSVDKDLMFRIDSYNKGKNEETKDETININLGKINGIHDLFCLVDVNEFIEMGKQLDKKVDTSLYIDIDNGQLHISNAKEFIIPIRIVSNDELKNISMKCNDVLEQDLDNSFSINSRQFTRDIKHIIGFTGKDKKYSSFNQNNVMFAIKDSKFYMLATDSYIAYKKLYNSVKTLKSKDLSVIISKDACSKIARMKKDKNTKVKFIDSGIVVQNGNYVLFSEYLNHSDDIVSKLIESKTDETMTFYKDEVKELYNFMTQCCKHKNSNIKSVVKNGTLKLECYDISSDITLANFSIKDVPNRDFELLYNPKLVKTCLNVLKAYDFMNVEQNSEIQPTMLTSVDNNRDFVKVIFMPIRQAK